VWPLHCPSSSADGGPVAFSNAALTSTFSLLLHPLFSLPRPPFFSTVGALSIGFDGVLTLVSARYYPEGTSCSSVSPKPAVSPETTPRSVLCTFSAFIYLYLLSSTSRELDEVIFRVSHARRRSLISSLNAEPLHPQSLYAGLPCVSQLVFPTGKFLVCAFGKLKTSLISVQLFREPILDAMGIVRIHSWWSPVSFQQYIRPDLTKNRITPATIRFDLLPWELLPVRTGEYLHWTSA